MGNRNKDSYWVSPFEVMDAITGFDFTRRVLNDINEGLLLTVDNTVTNLSYDKQIEFIKREFIKRYLYKNIIDESDSKFAYHLAESIMNAEVFTNEPCKDDHYSEYWNVKDKQSEGDVFIDTSERKGWQLVLCSDIDSLKPNSETKFAITSPGYRYPVLGLDSKDILWVSITPNELITMRDDIKAARGKVLCYGLGLGYYQNEISMKDNVTEIVTVEYDERIIKLFREHILPNLPYKDKIKIVHADAFKHAEELKAKEYDTIFVDIWDSPSEQAGYDYDKMRKLLKGKCKNTRYWIENSFLRQRSEFISLFLYTQVLSDLFNIPVPLPDSKKQVMDKYMDYIELHLSKSERTLERVWSGIRRITEFRYLKDNLYLV